MSELRDILKAIFRHVKCRLTNGFKDQDPFRFAITDWPSGPTASVYVKSVKGQPLPSEVKVLEMGVEGDALIRHMWHPFTSNEDHVLPTLALSDPKMFETLDRSLKVLRSRYR